MADIDLFTAAVIFFTYVVIDMLYAGYVLCVSSRRAWSAAVLGSALYSLGALGVMTYSQNAFYIIPLACGSFVGTVLVIKLHDRFAPENSKS